jgi:hypothetical protein
MSYPKPSSSLPTVGTPSSGFLADGGAWHNYILDAIRNNSMLTAGITPDAMRDGIDWLFNANKINSTEKGYLHDYIDEFAVYYDSNIDE